jgi:hypothetical protein
MNGLKNRTGWATLAAGAIYLAFSAGVVNASSAAVNLTTVGVLVSLRYRFDLPWF